jgi:hypothetical protein
MKNLITKTSFLVICLVVVCSILPSGSFGQTNDTNMVSDKATKDSAIIVWLEGLHEQGVTTEDDSIVISKEAQRLMTDAQYRQLMYPKVYDWQMVISSIQRQDLKKAFWYLINLYMIDNKNKDIVIKSLLSYDRVFKMDKVLVNTFYTYVLVDTEIGVVTDGQFKVTEPHMMEKKLNALKEIIFYLEKYRTKESTNK